MIVSGPPEEVASVGLAAGRIRRFAEAIIQGHQLGIRPGDHHEPWTLDFQRLAVPIYTAALSWNYLTKLAAGFKDCADLMVTLGGPKTAATEWAHMQQYLRSAAAAIDEQAPTEHNTADNTTAADLAPVTPPIMPFHLLAAAISTEGAEQLQQIGTAIERCAGSIDESPLTDQEADWLRRIINGDRVLDIATSSGYSERALYRALSELWQRLGVDNRNEAIALAAENGWI